MYKGLNAWKLAKPIRELLSSPSSFSPQAVAAPSPVNMIGAAGMNVMVMPAPLALNDAGAAGGAFASSGPNAPQESFPEVVALQATYLEPSNDKHGGSKLLVC